MPPVSGSQWRRSSARFVGRRARLRGALRSAGDWLSLSGRRDADATFAPPFRLPLPFSTERDPLDTPTPTRMPLLSCSAGIACALYPHLPTNSLSLSSSLSLCISLFVSLSGNERSAPERSRTQGCWPAVTHPSAGCHSIYSLEDRAGGLEDDGIVAGWELWGRWELEISSLLDFDVDVGFSESRGRVWNAGPFFFFFFGRRLFVIRKFWVSRMGGWRILSFFFSFSYRCRSKMEVNKGIQFNLFVEM